jgi:hypothetical protein
MIGTQSEKSSGQILEHNNNSSDSNNSSSRDIEGTSQSGISIPPTPSDAITPPPKPVLPEGGLQGWLAVLACWCIMFNTFGYINAFGYVLSPIM